MIGLVVAGHILLVDLSLPVNECLCVNQFISHQTCSPKSINEVPENRSWLCLKK